MRSTKRRFWEKVKVSSSVGCWLWMGHTHHAGHGQFYYNGRAHYAHRISWLLTFGEIGDNCILHKCDNPSCVNPFHLFSGTQQDNIADMIAKGRMACGEKRSRKGSKHGMAKLTESDVLHIRELRKDGKYLKEIAKVFNVTETSVSNIVRRKSWRHI